MKVSLRLEHHPAHVHDPDPLFQTQILDAGTEVLDDADVLKFIREKRAQHKSEDALAKTEGRKNNRPANYTKALQKVSNCPSATYSVTQSASTNHRRLRSL